MKAFELPPGTSVCPYDNEYEDEWLIVLEGTVEVRTPDGRETLECGDAVRFAPGPGGAHKVMNTSVEPARVVLLSRSQEDSDRVMLRREAPVAVYPDSEHGQRDYWDRER